METRNCLLAKLGNDRMTRSYCGGDKLGRQLGKLEDNVSSYDMYIVKLLTSPGAAPVTSSEEYMR